MDFPSGLSDGIKGALGGAVKGVKAVVEPVAEFATGVAKTMVKELTEVWRGFFGSPVTGPTNWNAYTHQEMWQMLRDQADPGQVGEQSSVLDERGRNAFDTADEIDREQRTVSGFWRGRSSDAFGTALGRHRSGVAAHADHATALGIAVAKASAALARAQHEMPAPVDVDSATRQGAATGATFGRVVGGGPGGALGLVAGAGASWFGSSVVAANKKAEAVAVMERFEESLYGAVLPDPPKEEPPPPPLPPPPPVLVPVPIPGPGGRSPSPGPGDPGAPWLSGGGPDGSGTGPSLSPGGTAGGPSGFVTDLPDGRTSAAGSFGNPIGSTSAAAAGPLGGLATGPDGRASGAPVGWRQLVGAGRPDLLSGDAGRQVVAGRMGAPGFPGMGAPAGTSRREEDAEHRNRMPSKHKLFAVDEKPFPPVIGG